MKNPAATGYDGSGRPPTPEQVKIVQFLVDNWEKADIFAVIAPTAVGKTYVMRTIKRNTQNCRLVTLSRDLQKQISAEYPSCTPVMGAANYATKQECLEARVRACDPCEDTICNAASLYYLQRHPMFQASFEPAEVVVLDEADAIIQFLDLLVASTSTMQRSEGAVMNGDKVAYNLLDGELDAASLLRLLRARVGQLSLGIEQEILRPTKSPRKYAEMENKYVQYTNMIEMLEEEGHLVGVAKRRLSRGHYSVSLTPTRLPLGLFKKVFNAKKIVMMSATLFDDTLFAACPTQRIARFEVNSPIPVDRRRVVFSPLDVEQWWPVDYDKMAAKVEAVLAKYSNLRPCLIHTTYSDAKELSARMTTPHLMYSDRDAKPEVLDKWKREGGVLIGSGVSTGLDLKEDLCRLNIITKLQFPARFDDYVVKKGAVDHRWSALRALTNLIQACGRSTRSPTDFSVTVCLDGRVHDLVRRCKGHVPKYFLEALDLFVTQI